jgi:hypothetical protein
MTGGSVAETGPRVRNERPNPNKQAMPRMNPLRQAFADEHFAIALNSARRHFKSDD